MKRGSKRDEILKALGESELEKILSVGKDGKKIKQGFARQTEDELLKKVEQLIELSEKAETGGIGTEAARNPPPLVAIPSERVTPAPEKKEKRVKKKRRSNRKDPQEIAETVAEFLRTPLNPDKKISRENPSFGKVIYLFIKSKLLYHSKRSTKKPKYVLPDFHEIIDRESTCSDLLIDWIVNHKFLAKEK